MRLALYPQLCMWPPGKGHKLRMSYKEPTFPAVGEWRPCPEWRASGYTRVSTTVFHYDFFLPISPYSSINVIDYETMLLGTYRFIILPYAWWIGPFVITKSSFFICCNVYCLTPIFSEINIVIPDFFCLMVPWCIFIHPFNFNLSVTFILDLSF